MGSATLLFAVLSGFGLAALAPWLTRRLGDRIGWILALLPLSLTIYFAICLPAIVRGHALHQHWEWVPSLGIQLAFRLDGLSLLFALLITLIGSLILIYAGGYLKGHTDLGRFYAILLAFMASMLGLVLSDNLISLFVFWELTSITSYLLIGFDHENTEARKFALQGLLVTGGGGLVLMAGLILLGTLGESYSLSQLLAQDDVLRARLHDHPLTPAILLCILTGAFSKSAQFPFHFWLPNAMAAPTPVSAYLHSATMVKAGIYLLARLNPLFGAEPLWTQLLMFSGGLTMLIGAWLAYTATQIKRVLAYSTIMALGTLTLLLGIGTDYALIAFASFLLAHALYKGALFMLAGILDHQTGSKDLLALGGLGRVMPVSATIAVIAALSLAGLPPLFGFVGKELIFEALLASQGAAVYALVAMLLAAILTTAVAGVIAYRPFFAPAVVTPKQPKEAPWPLLAGPLVLALLSLGLGLMPALPGEWLISGAVQASRGTPVEVKLSLWHGFNLPLLLSLLSLGGGVILFAIWRRSREPLERLRPLYERIGPEAAYFNLMQGLTRVAAWQTGQIQSGKLGNYLIVLVMSTIGLVGYTLLSQYGLQLHLDLDGLQFYEVAIVALMVIAALFALTTPSRLAAVAAMGASGFCIALLFMLFGAPDPAITQVLFETLMVILLVLVLFKLPRFARYSSRFEYARDACVAVLGGSLMTLLVLAAIDVDFHQSISQFYVEAAYSQAQGRNIVNVILVDFRGLDTLGEIFVLAIAALGVFSLLKLRGKVADDQA